MPFVPQTLPAQSATVVQSRPTAAPHVFVVALQRVVKHTACAAAPVHMPVRTPSLGIASPAASLGLHACAARSQRSAAAQSASIQQPPEETQVPEVAAHVPDWHTAAPVATAHPTSPVAYPHRAFEPHALLTHWLGAVHSPAFGRAHVTVVGLHRPPKHAALTPDASQSAWSPSAGAADPGASFGVQVNVARWQN